MGSGGWKVPMSDVGSLVVEKLELVDSESEGGECESIKEVKDAWGGSIQVQSAILFLTVAVESKGYHRSTKF